MNVVSLTSELVAFPSVSERSNVPAAEFVRERLLELGCRVERVPYVDENGVKKLCVLGKLGEGRGGLSLLSHVDVVPVDGQVWTGDPFKTRIVCGRLIGRGACDMKGAIAAMVGAVNRVDSATLRKPLWLAFTFQEEIGCHGAKLLERLAPLPVEHCIIGEPTGLRPAIRHKGYAAGIFRLHGRPCHSSDPNEGASAIHGAARAIDALLGLADEWQGRGEPDCGLEPPWTTMNIGMVEGGSARNVVPEHASFVLELRPLPGQSPQALFDEVHACAREAVAGIAGLDLEFEAHERDEALATDPQSDVVRWLVERTGEQTITVPFYTEGPTFDRMGARTCICGPGEIAQAHREDEWVELDALEAATDLYVDAIKEFCT